MSSAPMFVEGPRLYFRAVQPSDAEGNYFKWMNDPEVLQYLESRYRPQSVESLREYIAQMSNSPDIVFCAIIRKEDGRHIGNIKLGPIDWIHRRGEIGLLIGEKDTWGKGYATEIFKMIVRHAFTVLNLNKVTAGAYADNGGSSKALIRAGFVQEGLRKNHCFMNGAYTDLAVFGVLRDDFLRQELPQQALVHDLDTSALA